MSRHSASIHWRHAPHPTEPGTYSRNHIVQLNGGQTVNVSAAAEFKGDPACADPEQLLVSSLASCHMLFFLAIAQLQGYRVEEYDDQPAGYLEKGADGRTSMTRIELNPVVRFGGEKIPDEAALARLHALAHKNCFVANSIKAEVVIAKQPVDG